MNESFLKKIGGWIKQRLIQIPENDHYITAWFIISIGFTTTLSAIVTALSTPVGATITSHILNVSKMIAINAIIFPIWTLVIASLLSFIYLPLPRLFFASFSYLLITTFVILKVAKSGILFSFIISIIYGLIALLIGIILLVLFNKNINKMIKAILLIILLFIPTGQFLLGLVPDHHDYIPALASHMKPITEENPGVKGNYDYTFFTYGSGFDIQRKEFGADVTEIRPTVDASDIVTRWNNNRKTFWEFDQTNLPINGRVWIPDGEGEFPIVLMVHGNHAMEHFSTSGYDYLGEQLASRGFIAISVDEDFINYSNTYGSPNNNYELRSWMLLKHLVQLQEMNADQESHFYEKINFQQVALVGHSRGGQAALMAADYESFFDDKQLLTNMEKINIQAVVAISPTDTTVNGKKARIHNTSYLLLHGARDADVSSFRDDPFYRTTFDHDDSGFKASLYVANANHTHFNSNWGSMDLSFPRGIFLNQQQTMKAKEQQQLAKIYLSAFFESVFNDNSAYQKLFQDPRYAEKWLTNIDIVNKYKHASYSPIITFNKDKSEEDRLTGFTKTKITKAKDRSGNSRSTEALQIEWEHDSTYTVDLSAINLNTTDELVFTMANIDSENIPKIEIELESNDGVSTSKPLDDFFLFPAVISTDYTHFGLFDNSFREGRYKNSWEPVFQTFNIPIEVFEQENIDKMTMHFKSHSGKILIEEIGVW